MLFTSRLIPSPHLPQPICKPGRIKRLFLATLLAIGASGGAFPAWSQTEIEALTDVLDTPGSAGLGAALQVSPSPYRDAGSRYDVLPLYLYEGERFFLHSNRAGLKLWGESSQGRGGNYGHHVNAFIEQRLEGYPVNRQPAAVSGLTARVSGIDLGLTYLYSQPWGTLHAELLHDVSATSNGNEARLGYRYDWRSGKWSIKPSLTVSFRDSKLNNYYYGVQPFEALAGRPAYEAGSGINTTLGLYASYDLTESWRLLGGLSATRLSRQIQGSPIVDRGFIPAVYVGAAYDFGSHKRQTEAGSPTYFKLLYGKSTEDGCHLAKIITAQCLSTATVNPTYVTGIQVGKPFIQNFNGWPLDFVGYVGLTQHNDKGLQANGLQVDVFMKAIYSGFPWSDRVKTRLGLGVGLSAARRPPYIEVESQRANGQTASRLLNYLDPTIDVSVGDLVGVRALKDTYLGFGVSHRSGIFGKSRLFGNVNGGSNYIYTYLETAL